MSDILTSASESTQGLWPAVPAGPAKSTSRLHRLVVLRDTIATWRERVYFRRELEKLMKNNPELIDDIGLTIRQVEAEIVKPFWHR